MSTHHSFLILSHSPSKTFDQFVSRSAAAELLGVTTRTIDRTAKSGKLRIFKRGGRVFFSLTEIQSLAPQWPNSALSTLSTPVSISAPKGDLTPKNKIGDSTEDHGAGDSSLLLQIQKDFRDLVRRQEEFQQTTLQKLQDELRAMQTRLEGANFRVGQLEAELRHSVPLLDLTEKTSQVHELEIEVERLDRQFHDEQFGKVLFWLTSIIMTGITVFTLLFW